MRPYVLKGHERPVTQVKYNREGDLFVSSGREGNICLWSAQNGERLGTYVLPVGKNRNCSTVDISYDSKYLFTAMADGTVMWELETGKCLFTYDFGKFQCRACSLSVGNDMIAITTDIFGPDSVPKIHIYKVPDESELQESQNRKIQDDLKVTTIECFNEHGNYTRVLWVDCNTKLLTSSNDGFLRLFDVETGKIINEKQIHTDLFNDMQMTADEGFVITASSDETSKLVEVQSLETVFTYQMDRPIQSASVSPIFNHVIMAGGQDAAKVTTTAAKAGGFESRLFHKMYCNEFARVTGHNSVVNSVAFAPNGKGFVSGGEEGFVRLHHFDPEYFELEN